MITKEDLFALTQNSETQTLEFKRQWYWSAETKPDEKSKLYGELVKDIIALSNGYINFVGKNRYLIIGYCEKTNKFYDSNVRSATGIKSPKDLKKIIISKLNNFSSPIIPEIGVEFFKINECEVLCIEIQSPKTIIQLSKDLQTKTRQIDAGVVLVRKGVNSDAIKAANPEETKLLSDEFIKFSQKQPQIEQKINKKIRSIKETIQQYLDQNKNTQLEDGFPLIEKNHDDNIIFEYYRLKGLFNERHSFLYVHENTSQSKTYGYLRSKNLIQEDNKSLIILTEEPSITDPSKRKENLKSTFKAERIYFIDEFGREFLYSDYMFDYVKYNLPIYVDSPAEEELFGKSNAIDILKEWFSMPSNPLIVVKGHGGIGKTTLVKQFLDNVHETKNNVGILFIESNDIIKEIDKLAKENSKIDDVYDFYIAQRRNNNSNSSTSEKELSRELLQLSVDNGNMIIVLDGIDEVIAKLGSKFDAQAFIQGILTGYATNLEKTKIIITCRDYFWNKLTTDGKIIQISLRPFVEKLARDFFSQHFDGNQSKIQRGIDFANMFAINEDESSKSNTYIPYALDMIAFLIKQKSEDLDAINESEESSYLLNTKLSNDFLIYRFCHREIKKLNNLSVDSQINLLIDISFSENNSVSLYDIKSLFHQNDLPKISNDVIEKLKGHPLLNCSDTDQVIHFRYDFFSIFFKSLLITRYLKEIDLTKLTPRIIETMSNYIKFENSFTASIIERLTEVDYESLAIFIDDTIREIIKKTEIDENTRKRAVSSIFCLLLSTAKHRPNINFNIEKCTEIMNNIFGNGDVIEGMYIIDLENNGPRKPIFDFSGKKIKKSRFENYTNFWECQIDENTRFIETEFVNLQPRKGIKPKFYSLTFGEGCDTEDIGEIINAHNEEKTTKEIDIRSQIIKFFKLFYQAGNFYPRKQEQIKSKVFAGELIQPLIKEKVIEQFIDPKKATMEQYRVSESYRGIIKYIEQGSPSTELEDIIKIMRTKYNM